MTLRIPQGERVLGYSPMGFISSDAQILDPIFQNFST